MGFGSFMSQWGPTIASTVGSQLAGSGNSAPSVPQLPYQGAAADAAFSDISGLYNPYQQLQPLEYQQMLAMMQNPNLSGYMDAAKRSGQAYNKAGNQAGAGAKLLMKDARGIYNSSFDPRSELYNQLQNQNVDQSNVLNSMYGLQSSPYGAGVAGEHLNNFNVDWQNQQLQRQIAGAGAIGQNVSGAQNLRLGGAQDYLKSGLVPYSAYTGAIGDMNNAINGYMQGANAGNVPTQMAIGDWLQYLGMGNANAATNLAAFNQNNANTANTAAALYPMFNSAFQSWGGNGGFQPTPSSAYNTSAPDYQNLQPITPIQWDGGQTIQPVGGP
jgi:hypothetical protein